MNWREWLERGAEWIRTTFSLEDVDILQFALAAGIIATAFVLRKVLSIFIVRRIARRAAGGVGHDFLLALRQPIGQLSATQEPRPSVDARACPGQERAPCIDTESGSQGW